MTTPRDHHRIPKAYLAQFTDPDGFVWTYDARRAGPTRATPLNTAVERDLYSVIHEDGLSTAVESLLGKVESLGMPALLKLAGGAPLTDDDKGSFAAFVAATYLRSDIRRLEFAQAYVAAMQQVATLQIENDEKLGEEERENLLAFLTDKSRYEVLVRKDATLAPLGALLEVASVIRGKSWTVIEAPDDEVFITSDNPVTVRWPSGLATRFFDPGLAHPRAEVTFPLTPKFLWFGHTRQELWSRGAVPKAQVRELNRVRVTHSSGAIFANRRSEGLWRLAQKSARPPTPMFPSTEPPTRVRLERAQKFARRGQTG